MKYLHNENVEIYFHDFFLRGRYRDERIAPADKFKKLQFNLELWEYVQKKKT